MREEVHKCLAHQLITVDTEARDTEAFESIRQQDGVKRHDGNGDAGSGFLESIVEVNNRFRCG